MRIAATTTMMGMTFGLLIIASAIDATDARIGDLTIEKPWARASIGTSRPGAAYMMIRNDGAEPDRLVGVDSPIASRSEVHETIREGQTMKMRPASTVTISAGGTVEIKPGGLHVMLMGLLEPLTTGRTFTLTVRFEKAGAVAFDVPVAGPGARRPPE